MLLSALTGLLLPTYLGILLDDKKADKVQRGMMRGYKDEIKEEEGARRQKGKKRKKGKKGGRISKEKSKGQWWITHSVSGSIEEVLKYTISFVLVKNTIIRPISEIGRGHMNYSVSHG